MALNKPPAWGYERLVSNGELILQLHSFEVEHDHRAIGDPDKPHGFLLRFETDDFETAVARPRGDASGDRQARHRNPPSPAAATTGFLDGPLW
jgi:hypothetical protein